MAVQSTYQTVSQTASPAVESCSSLSSCTQTYSLKSRLKALLAPLHWLDQRLQQTIEVKNVLVGTAFEAFLLGSVVPTQAPAAAVISGSPLANLKQAFELSDFDVEVVLMAIAPELDRRYARLYATLQASSRRRPTVGLALDLLCKSTAEKDLRLARFDSGAPLLRFGLIQLKQQQREKMEPSAGAEVHVSDSFTLNPTVSRHLLGQSMRSQLSTYCQVSWPQKTYHVTNSPLLPELLARLQSGHVPMPLSLNFIGAGAKLPAAKTIAATTQRPLLIVDLHHLLDSETFDAAEIDYIAQQVILQGRLWHAVLYVKSEPVKNIDNRWFPAEIARSLASQPVTPIKQPDAAESLCDQLADYPGIVIFAGQAPLVSWANQNKGVINVPFTPLPSDDGSIRWSRGLSAEHITLGDTELFRQKLIDAAL
ncbi:MAG: hypothetical protein ACFB16_01150 [Phormidesmis sp.]